MKSYTDIEQSRKLAEILPLESADMFYDGVQDLYKEKVYNIPIDGSSITVRIGHTITERGIKANLLLPAWSLAVLLDVLPPIEGFKPIIDLDINQIRYEGKHRDKLIVNNENLIDACVEMIEKLHELNLL